VADPLGRAVAGTPFRPSASTWNRMRDAALALDAGAGNPSGLDVPHCLVRVRNDTGGDLAAFSVLALGASILDITVPLRVSPTPMFEGTTPAATSDAFAVLIEPALDGKFALAAIAGVVPVEVNVTDAGHGYATPTAASAARLTSAASGPARILDRVSGTGNKDAVVQLLGASGAAASPPATQYSFSTSFTADQVGVGGGTVATTGTLVTLAAGDYVLTWWVNFVPTAPGGWAVGDWLNFRTFVNALSGGDGFNAYRAWRYNGVPDKESVSKTTQMVLGSSTAIDIRCSGVSNLSGKGVTVTGGVVILPVDY
jgi:hypothetical protein